MKKTTEDMGNWGKAFAFFIVFAFLGVILVVAIQPIELKLKGSVAGEATIPIGENNIVLNNLEGEIYVKAPYFVVKQFIDMQTTKTFTDMPTVSIPLSTQQSGILPEGNWFDKYQATSKNMLFVGNKTCNTVFGKEFEFAFFFPVDSAFGNDTLPEGLMCRNSTVQLQYNLSESLTYEQVWKHIEFRSDKSDP